MSVSVPPVTARVVEEAAPAKINLALHIVGRRPDGYHLLDSLVVFAAPPAADRLTLSEVPPDPGTTASGPPLSISGAFGDGLDAGPDNLVLKALQALTEADPASPRRARLAIHLQKNLPVAAGVGGGSADAAAFIRAHRRLVGSEPDPNRLAAIALALGADVPVCLDGRPARMGGIGDVVEPLRPGALPPLPIVLARPPVAVPTAPVFAALDRRDNPPMPSLPAGFATPAALAAWLDTTRNDLEPAARRIAPQIGEVLAALSEADGALIARLSGSGATCFALFPNAGAAEACADALTRDHPDWWVVATEAATHDR